MKRAFVLIAAVVCVAKLSAEPALTIYNQNFAVVRDNIHLDLKVGENAISYAGATMRLEPDSVVLRDPTGARQLQILEQNFRADPVSQGLLLNYFEGKTIEFENDTAINGEVKKEIIHGKIIRSGYLPHLASYQQYGGPYAEPQMAFAPPEGGGGQPIIEVEGKLMFRLPGQPLFPALPNDSILKPTLTWAIASDKAGPVDAELGYITGGMSWHADYNLVAAENSDALDLVGWVTMDNQSGKSFEGAKIKLMAGEVNTVEPRRPRFAGASGAALAPGAPPVSEKAFDEYHLYTLARPATLLDRETKQVEFARGEGITSKVIYIYDGVAGDEGFNGWNDEGLRENRDYGTQSTRKVQVMREFSNSASNHLGLPLPAGRMRFYRRDADGQLEFTGENNIDHTPKDEWVRLSTGSAFDLVGERTRTDFRQSNNDRWIDESFQIKLRNHKKTPVEIRVVEHLYRWKNWNVSAKSDDFVKKDSRTIDFPVTVAPDKEKIVTYSVHYSW